MNEDYPQRVNFLSFLFFLIVDMYEVSVLNS